MQYVEVRVHGKIATIKMDRPEVRNALNPQLIEDLSTALSDVHQEHRVRAVVLCGAGDDFCSGMDLRVFGEISQMAPEHAFPEWLNAWRNLTELLEQMLRFPKPIVAAVDGAAVGAGLSLALASDLMVVTNRASLAASAVRRGLVGGATAALLTFRLGGAVAARMLLTGQPLQAEDAFRLGLCPPPVEPEQIWVKACEVGEQCAIAPREAMQATKRLLNESIGETLLSQLAAGAADSATACTTETATEGIKAFLENREPNWPH